MSLAELAIAKDSSYADAWAALANAWGTLADDFMSPLEALPLMRGAVDKALQLDPRSGDAHAQAATKYLFQDWDLDAAAREFDAALVIDSANVSAGTWYPAALELMPARPSWRSACASAVCG